MNRRSQPRGEMNIAAWSNSTKRWAEAGNSKIVGQSLPRRRSAGGGEVSYRRSQLLLNLCENHEAG